MSKPMQFKAYLTDLPIDHQKNKKGAKAFMTLINMCDEGFGNDAFLGAVLDLSEWYYQLSKGHNAIPMTGTDLESLHNEVGGVSEALKSGGGEA